MEKFLKVNFLDFDLMCVLAVRGLTIPAADCTKPTQCLVTLVFKSYLDGPIQVRLENKCH